MLTHKGNAAQVPASTHVHQFEGVAFLQALHFTSQLQHPIKWWRYAHESRLVLLGTGELGLWLQVSPESPGQPLSL